MVYLKWLVFCIPDLLMQVIGKLLSPILPLFVRTERNEKGEIDWKTDGSARIANLPKWLMWFQTDDHDCDGDRGSWERHGGFKWYQIYIRRTAWFFRNTGYTFCINVLGIPVYPSDCLEVRGNPDASDTNGISGFCYRRVYRDDKLIAFQYYYIKWYENKLWKACIRLGVGWKLWGNWHNENGKTAMHMMYFNPLKKFELKKN